MKHNSLFIILSVLFACHGNKPDNKTNTLHTQKDSSFLQNAKKTSITSDSTPRDSILVWSTLESINEKLISIKDSSSTEVLEDLFQKTVQIAFGNDLGNEFDKMRKEAYNSNDFSTIDLFTKSCYPAITVVIMGESNNIGVNIDSFLKRCVPNTETYRFFELSKDGFYYDSEICRIGTAEFPLWIERNESSFQGKTDFEKAKLYLEKWKLIQQKQKGFYRSIAESTIHCLETNIKSKRSETESQ